MNKKLLLLFVIALFSLELMGQKTKSKSDEPDNKNIEKYLDDGKKGNVCNLIRLRLSPSLSGYYGASYERKFGRRFGLEGGLYIKPGGKGLFEFERVTFNNDIGDYQMDNKISSGVGFTIYPKIYYVNNKYINNGFYLGLRTTMHNYSVESYYNDVNTSKTKQNIKASFLGVGLFSGFHTQLGANVTFGTEWGLMFYNDKYKAVKGEDYDYNTSQVIVVSKDLNSSGLNLIGDITLGFLF